MSIYIYPGGRLAFEKCNVHTHDTLYTVAINLVDVEYVGVNLLSRFIFSKVYRYPSRNRSSSKFVRWNPAFFQFPSPPDKTAERRSTRLC